MKPVKESLVKYFIKNDQKNIIASTPDQDFLPYSVHYDKRTILTKNGELMQFIKVVGFNNTSVYADLIPLREAVRDAIRENITKNNFALWFTTIRRKKDISPSGEFNDVFSSKINETWDEMNNFKDDYVNELYITIIIEGLDTSISNFKSFIRSFSKISTMALHKQFLANSCEELTKVTQGIFSAITDYGARILELTEREGVMYSEPMSFLGKICNLEDRDFPVFVNDISEDLLSNKIAFSNRQIEIISGKNRHFGAILSLKEYIEVETEALDKVLQSPFEFIITQSFDFSYSELDLEVFKYQDNILRVSKSEDFREMMGMANFFESVDGTNTDYGKLQTTLMIISDSSDKLDVDMRFVVEKFQSLGLVTVREDVFLEDCFWAQLPGNFRFLKRQKIINSYRIAGFGSLYSFDSGVMEGNFWGPAVATFKTINNNPYFFNFHDGDNGHSLFIGGDSSGKTVLLNFILAQARRYNNKIFYIDFDNKAQNFLELLGGFYYKISAENDDKHSLKINPFLLIDGDDRRKFLSEFIYALIYHSSQNIPAQEMQLIANYVDKIITNKTYNFSEAINIFNNEETKNIFAILKYWNEENLSGIFNHQKEINWNDRMMGFDLTGCKDRAVILTPILYYLLYKIEAIFNNNNTPAIIVFKDANFLLKSPIFIDKIANILDRLRQKNCLAIFSINSHNIKSDDDLKLLSIISQKVASKFILKDAVLSPQLLQILDLKDQELLYIKNFQDYNRKFLLKSGEDSVVINFDLSNHKPLLRLISSSPEDIAILEEIFNHAKQEGKIIDNETAIKQFYEIIGVLEQELIEERKKIMRQEKLAKMKKLREIKGGDED